MACLNAGPLDRAAGSCLLPALVSDESYPVSAGSGETLSAGECPPAFCLPPTTPPPEPTPDPPELLEDKDDPPVFRFALFEDDPLPLRWPRGAGDSVTGFGSICSIEECDDRNPPPADDDTEVPNCPSPPANAGISSSSSTQSLSSPAEAWYVCFPENTSLIDIGSLLGGKIASTSIGRCAVRDDHPGGSMPHDFFQLDRPTAGLINGPCRFCATNVAPPNRLEPSSAVRLDRVLKGDAVRGPPSPSDGS
jgi:hypothetical protein